jgi:hypothetical protein
VSARADDEYIRGLVRETVLGLAMNDLAAQRDGFIVGERPRTSEFVMGEASCCGVVGLIGEVRIDHRR